MEVAKENKEMKVEYMTYYMELRRSEERGMEKGMEKGREEGRAEGRAEGRWATLAELVREGVLTLKEAAKKAGMSEESFRKIAAL